VSCVDSVAIRRIASLASLILALALASAGVAGATTWNTGDMVTYSQNSWGDMPDGSNAATVLLNNFASVYASSGGVLSVGSASGFRMFFSDVDSVLAHLPSVGDFGPLDANIINPTTPSRISTWSLKNSTARSSWAYRASGRKITSTPQYRSPPRCSSSAAASPGWCCSGARGAAESAASPIA